MNAGSFDVRSWPARIGVHPGDTVQLMADATRMAWNARRAGERLDLDALLNAFADAVGTSGLLLVPTFNFDLRDGDDFDVRSTRSMSGALANAALHHERFLRTQHPLHSFAVTGPGADELAGSMVAGSFDQAGPFGLLRERRGVLVALDLPLNDALTFAHHVEQMVGVTYRKQTTFAIRHSDAGGRTAIRHFSIFAKKPGHINDFAGLEQKLVSAGAFAQGEVDGSRWIRVDLALAYDVIADDIRKNRARSIHRFSWRLWLRENIKNALRRLGIRSRNERLAHGARTA